VAVFKENKDSTVLTIVEVIEKPNTQIIKRQKK
jgi:hypothetical protein